jgi:hypothetical protein
VVGGLAPGGGRLGPASVPVPTRLGRGRASAMGDRQLQRAAACSTTGGSMGLGGRAAPERRVWRCVAVAWWVFSLS